MLDFTDPAVFSASKVSAGVCQSPFIFRSTVVSEPLICLELMQYGQCMFVVGTRIAATTTGSRLLCLYRL